MVNLLQNPVMTDFVYPFLLIFFIVFAILEKTKLFGDSKKQINALVALVISLIFVSAIFPKIIVGNLMLFLVLALVIAFVGLLIWGFLVGDASGGGWAIGAKGKKWWAAVLIVVMIVAVVWATGLYVGLEGVFDWLFNSKNSSAFWTNFFLVAFVVAAIAIVFGVKGLAGGDGKK
jgi:hypothetical protein